MASDLQFVEYVCAQCGDGVTSRRIFDDYGICYRGRLIGMVCNNRFYVLITYSGNDYLIDMVGRAKKTIPFEGAGAYLEIECLDRPDILHTLVIKTYCELT